MRFFDDRADSEVTGHAILLCITILGISTITMYGLPAIQGLQDMAHVKNIEEAFTVFDSRASKTSLAEAQRQMTEINLGGGYMTVLPNASEPSYIFVELQNGTSEIYTVLIPMGKIVYRLGDREVGYEGGGVWSKYPAGSTMLSPPEFHYNGITLTLPVVNISGSSSTGGKGRVSLNIEKKGEPKRLYPTASYANPIPENVTIVNLTIKSEYYDAWANFFKSSPLTLVYPDPVGKKVTVTLGTPPIVSNFYYGVLASETIKLGQSAAIDSYNSSIGSYIISKSDNGRIRANRQIILRNTAVVNGTAETADNGSISCYNGNSCGTITKSAYSGSIDPGITVGGDRWGGVEWILLKDTTYTVDDRINTYKATLPNNDPFNCFSGANRTILDSSTWGLLPSCTITTGNYYLTKFRVDNKDLFFDTSLGPVNIAAEIPDNDYVFLKRANITVTGPNPVRLYLKGGGGSYQGSPISMSIGGAGGGVNNPDAAIVDIFGNTNQTSSWFQVYSSSKYEIQYQQQSQLCGVLYAPFAKISVEQGAKVYGALVGKLFSITQSQDIHFDESLRDLNMGLDSGTTIMYLHITRNDVEVKVN